MNKHRKKLSKTVLEMKFMKRTKIEQEKHDDETENIDLLTAGRTRAGVLSNYIHERNWELIEKLRSPRLNYGMSRKQQETTQKQNLNPKEEQDEGAAAEIEDYQPKAKHIRYNDDGDD